MTLKPDWRAMAEPWANRIAEAYRTGTGAALDANDRKTLAAYVVEEISTCMILAISGDDWGFARVNPKISDWERLMRLRRGFRLLTVDEGRGSLTMGDDPRAR